MHRLISKLLRVLASLIAAPGSKVTTSEDPRAQRNVTKSRCAFLFENHADVDSLTSGLDA